MILSVKDGSFAYADGKTVFSDVNLSVSSGEILAVIGANGAGKTTLLKCITGILRWKSGASCIDGENISSISDRRLWNILSYVPQSRGNTVSYTVTDMVLLGLSGKIGIFSKPQKKDFDEVMLLLSDLGIYHLRDKKCSELSGGELQMVLIARALISKPEFIVLDEPETNLDFKNQYIVLDTVKSLAKKGVGCILNTHYPEHALQFADKALILCGKTAIFGKTDEIMTEENIEKAFGIKTVITDVETGNNTYEKVIVRNHTQRL